MLPYILRRLAGIIPVMWIIATLTFFLIRLAPGGPFDSEQKIPPEIMKNLQAKYHMDEPIGVQYLRYMSDLAKGDLGFSFKYPNRTVNSIIVETFPISATIGIVGLIYALLLGGFAGLIAASRKNSLRDYIAMLFSLVGVCLPSFVIGPILVLIFAVHLDWVDVGGWNDPTDVILPGITLGTLYAAIFARLIRGGVLDILGQDFILTAKAKGLGKAKIMFRHTLKGGILPTITYLGPAVTAMITGSLVVETIFNLPGIGRFFVQSALNRDYTLVMGCVLFVAFLISVLNLLVDIAYTFLDPRVSYEENS